MKAWIKIPKSKLLNMFPYIPFDIKIHLVVEFSFKAHPSTNSSNNMFL